MSSTGGTDPNAFPRLVSGRAHPERNSPPAARRGLGIEFDQGWLERVHVNLSAVERRASAFPARRAVKKTWQAAWLLKAVTLMDLTTLSADDTPGRVARLCAKARAPVRTDLLDALGWDGRARTPAADAGES